MTALCLAHHPQLLRGTSVLPLAAGGNNRLINLLSHRNEFGDLPGRFAQICRDICERDLSPVLLDIAPWLVKQFSILPEQRTGASTAPRAFV